MKNALLSKRFKVLVITTIMFALVSCSVEMKTNLSEPTTVTIPTSTILPSTTPFLTPSALPTKTGNVAKEIPGVRKACVDIEAKPPEPLEYEGKLVFESLANIPSPYTFYNLKAGEVTSPEIVGQRAAVSPDRTLIAFDNFDNASIDVQTLQGKQVASIQWGENWCWMERWLDNETIVVVLCEPLNGDTLNYRVPPRVVLVNPFTKTVKMMESDYPELVTFYGHVDQWYPYSWTVYHANQDLLVYANEYRYYLYRISEKRILSKIDTGPVTNPPIWSPDGSKFIVFGDFDEFYIGTDEGKVSKITKLNQNKQTSEVGEVSADFYSWSPDNRHVAFWLHLGWKTETFGTLAVLDTKTGDMTDYCVPERQPYSFQRPPYPIWSPDGKQLIVGYNYHKNEDANEVLLIDIEKMLAFPISKNNNPAGWLLTQ